MAPTSGLAGARALAAIEAWTGTQARSRGMTRAASIRDTLHQFGW